MNCMYARLVMVRRHLAHRLLLCVSLRFFLVMFWSGCIAAADDALAGGGEGAFGAFGAMGAMGAAAAAVVLFAAAESSAISVLTGLPFAVDMV